MMQKAPVKARIKPVVVNEWRPIQIAVGEIKGQTDDFVVVGGHQDSWEGPQATDNATGSACMLELARVFNRHRDKLRRGLVFGFWTAHETGTMIGSSWFVDRNWDRLRRNGVAYLQIDQPGCIGATGWGSTANTELRRFQQAIDARLTGNRPRSCRRALKIGDTSFLGVGVPMLTSLATYDPGYLKETANATLGWWHHTVENTLDKVDWDGTAAASSRVWRLSLGAVHGAGTAVRLRAGGRRSAATIDGVEGRRRPAVAFAADRFGRRVEGSGGPSRRCGTERRRSTRHRPTRSMPA